MKRYFSALAVFLFLLFMLLRPADVTAGASEGLRVCAASVIPALFPFLVVSRVLTGLLPLRGGKHRLLGLPGAALPLLALSFLGGYPAGAAAVVSAYESRELTKAEAERSLCCCNNSGPGFFMAVLGNVVFHNPMAGICLYLIHIFAALCVAAVTAKPLPPVRIQRLNPASPCSVTQLFLRSLTEGCTVMLQVCGMVVFFNVLTRLLPLPPLLLGSLELASGTLRLSADALGFVCAAFLMGWGGLCVHFQAMELWSKVGLQPKQYFFSKLLHGSFSAVFAGAICFRSPEVYGLSVGILFLCIIFPYFRKKWAGNSLRNAI